LFVVRNVIGAGGGSGLNAHNIVNTSE